MSDFYELKKKVADTLGTAAEVTKDIAAKTADYAKGFAQKTADVTKSVSHIAKLKVEIGSEKDAVRKAYLEIGKLYYETNKEEPGGVFTQLCDEITLAMENIDAKEYEIDELKNYLRQNGSDVDVEFEDITPRGSDEFYVCGNENGVEYGREQEEYYRQCHVECDLVEEDDCGVASTVDGEGDGDSEVSE